MPLHDLTRSVPAFVRFGWNAAPLAEQFDGIGLDTATIDQFQQDGDAILRLVIRGVITDGERERAMARLTGHIRKAIGQARRAAAKQES